ncbi:MAG: zinc-binding dehydrogenase, partial [Egibacteraceae bacterium]
RLGGQLLGRRVLVTGAAGGVGRFAVELASRSGAGVTGIASTPERAAGLRELGAGDVLHDIADAQGTFDLILESVGGSSLSTAVGLLAPDGVCVVFGNSSGQPSALGFADFAGCPRARFLPFRVYESGEPPTFGQDLARLVALVASGRLHPGIGFLGDWGEPQAAVVALRDRQVRGKAVLEVS